MNIAAIFFISIFIQCISNINGDTDDIKITRDDLNAIKDSINFRGKVALVTGSNSGIGAATVRLLSFLGASVVVTGRNESRINEVVNDCWELSPCNIKPLGIRLDLSIPGNADKLIKRTIAKFKKIDILVNNAGIGLFAVISDPNFNDVYEESHLINEVAVVELTRLAIPYLNQTSGSIIYIASLFARNPVVSVSAYSMAKNALVALAAAVTRDVGSNIKVNVISPGVVDGTRIFRYAPGVRPVLINNTIAATPLRRAGVPLDIAKAIVFLASPLSSYINGFNLFLDGGLYIPIL